MNKIVFVGLTTLALTAFASAQAISESFVDIGGATTNGQLGGANLEANGWFFVNESDSRGTTDWFQGNDAVFAAHSGAATEYIGANFNNTAASVVDNWMMMPTRTLSNGDTLSFWTRTVTGNTFPDRLEVRLSENGASTSTADFSTVLLEINPTLASGGYPDDWAEFNITVSGLNAPVDGRLAFRYFVTDGGPTGNNSNYIGIDTVDYNPVPEPATLAVLGLGGLALLRRKRK